MIGGIRIDAAGKRTVVASGARRCLFGRASDTDRERMTADSRDRTRFIDDEKRRQWNFDFERMTPLAGRWHWQLVHGSGGTVNSTAAGDASSTAVTGSQADEVSSSTSTAPAVDSTTVVETTDAPTDRRRRKRRRQTTLPGKSAASSLSS